MTKVQIALFDERVLAVVATPPQSPRRFGVVQEMVMESLRRKPIDGIPTLPLTAMMRLIDRALQRLKGRGSVEFRKGSDGGWTLPSRRII